ncbi:hypothetical protein JKF63_02962 [Porcisia hertigi]|uniref:TOG domain-containing protein n=1 Tax=Porcisia hertigi TaxID=2761500 RepID=A0A836I899_9TRYP|nr:hypothetical protein JKF63_02962 [Porcisia hertigi]
MSLEDRPVGGGSASKPFRPPSEAPEDFSSCAVSELLSHTNWKARRCGYERIQKDPTQYKNLLLSNLKVVANEGNAMVQESAIEALVVVLSECNDTERSQLSEGTLSFVVEKGITGRPKALQLSQQFIFALVEEGNAAAVFASLLSAFAHKTLKNRLVAAQTATSLISDYGVHSFPLKDILKAMQPLFNDANAQVRKEAVALCCQCYRYIGAGIKSFLTELREVQLQELQRQFDGLSVGEKPPKTIKGAVTSASNGKAFSAAVMPIGSLTGEDTASAVDDTVFKLLEESPVLPRLPKKFFSVALNKEATWQERVKYVNEHLVPLLAVPRFRAKDDYHELASMIKEYLVDPQAPLMLLGFKMVQDCARGLRGDFGPHGRLFVAPLLDKMKDKKVSVQLHVMKTLEDLICFNCLSMDQCNDDFEQALQSKNPTQRTVMLSFLIRMVDTLGDRSRYVKLGRSTAMLTRVVSDEKASIRDVAYVLLDRLVKAFGEDQYKSVLSGLDDNQRHNMAVAVSRGAPVVGPRSAVSQQTTSVVTPHGSNTTGTTPFNSPAKKVPRVEESFAATAPPPRPPRVRTTSAPAPAVVTRRLSAPGKDDGSDAGRERQRLPLPPRTLSLPRRAPISHASDNEPLSAPGSRALATRSSGADQCNSKTPAEDAVALESLLPSKMESLTMILGMLNGDNVVLDLVRSHEWARRQEGMNKLLTMVQEWTPAQTTRTLEYLVVYIRAHPSFREPTFQVFSLVSQVFLAALTKVVTLTMAAGYAIVSGFTSRFAEPKNQTLVREVCTLVAGKLGQRFVVRHMMDTAAMIKTPKLLVEVCGYVREAVRQQPDTEEAERDAVETRGVLYFIKTVCADFNNAGVRQEVVLLLVALHRSPHASVAAVQRCVASLQPPLPAMFERELNRTPDATTDARPLPPTKVSAALPAGAAMSAPTPSTQARPRTVNHPSGVGTRASALAQSSPNRQSEERPPLSDAEASLDSRQRPSSLGGAGVPARLSSGRTSSVKPLSRNSSSTSAECQGGLRLILHDINSGEDWRDRLSGIRRAEAFVAETPRPLPGHCAAALLKALQGRFEEANKNIIVDVLRFIPVVVEAAGQEECRVALRQLTPGVLAMLGDQKATLREEARNVAFFVMNVLGLESILPLLQRPLSSDSNVCRQNALEIMVNGFERLPADATLPRAGMQLLTPAVIASTMDRMLDVRLVAEQVLGWMLGVVGEDAIIHTVKQLKPAEQQAVMPAVERQIERRRRQAQQRQLEEEEEKPPSQRPSLAKSMQPLATAGNGHLDNEEAHRTTTTLAAPQTNSSVDPHMVIGGTTTPHRLSGVHSPSDARPGTDATRRGGGNASGGAPASRLSTQTRTTHQDPAIIDAPRSPPPSRSSAVAHKDGTATQELSSPRESAARGSAHQSRVSSALRVSMPAKTPSPPSNAVHSSVAPTDASLVPEGTEERYTIREILVGLRSATPEVALEMCKDFGSHLRAGVDCGTPEVVQLMVERLYENTQHFNIRLAQGLMECLTAMFMTPRCAMRCHSQLLFRMMGAFFDCLLSEKFSQHASVIKALNTTTLKLLEGCPINDVFSALLSRLMTYSTAYLATGQKADLKFIQVTVKCIMRVDFTEVSPDTVILCCHEYLLQHPPSAFRKLDDLPIRTVKTILQTTTKRHKTSLLTTAENLVGPQNLVTHFIRACLELCDRADKERGQNEQQAIEESRQERRASQSPAPTSAKERTRSSLPPPTTRASITSAAAAAAATATGASASNTTLATATFPVTINKGTAMPLEQKKRPSHHADPNATLEPFPNETAVAPSVSSSRDPVLLSTPTYTVPNPIKVPSRVSSTSTFGKGSLKSATESPPTVATPSTVRSRGGRNGTASPIRPNSLTVSSGDSRRDLTEIFAHIRNHVTSNSGIDELYSFLKEAPQTSYEDTFRVHFNRCSEAFRLYIKRKLQRKLEDDITKPPNFNLPQVIQSLP